ncbi:MAG: hypothetical protein QOG99_115 [Frankiales bacterium]|nr:hypothetical protein [Frankiales bacterium]
MWKPARGWGWGQLILAAVLIAGLFGVDRLSWVILLPVAVGTAASGLRDLLLSPVLTADADGLLVVDGVRRVRAGWSEVERLRTVQDRRTPLLELDLGDRVVVLTARRLGAPVDEVLEAQVELRLS